MGSTQNNSLDTLTDYKLKLGLAFGCSNPEVIFKIKIREQLSRLLPDLNKTDLDIASDFFYAINTKTNETKAKGALLKHVAFIYDRSCIYLPGSLERIDAKIRLMNFQLILKKYFTASEVKAGLWPKTYINLPFHLEMDSVAAFADTTLAEIKPGDLPKKVKTFLQFRIDETGVKYMDFVKGKAKSVIFIPRMEKTIKLKDQQDQGTVEELTRTIFIDPFGEILGSLSPDWSVAAAIVHEAYHLDYYDKYGDQPTKMDSLHNERYANINTFHFYEALLASGISLSKNDIESIKTEMKICKLKIENYNKRLGLPPDDMSQ